MRSPVLLLAILCSICVGELTDRELSVLCPKGIKCVTSKTFIFCENNNIFLAYGKKIFACEGNFVCDEQDPYNGCVHQKFYKDLTQDKTKIVIDINIVDKDKKKGENCSSDADFPIDASPTELPPPLDSNLVEKPTNNSNSSQESVTDSNLVHKSTTLKNDEDGKETTPVLSFDTIFRPKPFNSSSTDVPFSDKNTKENPDFPLEASTLPSHIDEKKASTVAYSPKEALQSVKLPAINKPTTSEDHTVSTSKVSTPPTDASDEKSTQGDVTNEPSDTSSSEESSADFNSEEDDDDDDGTLDNVSSDTTFRPESYRRQPNGIFRPQSQAVQPTDTENQEIPSDDRNPFSNKGEKTPDFPLEASTLSSHIDKEKASTVAYSPKEALQSVKLPAINKPTTSEDHTVSTSKVSTPPTDASDKKITQGDVTNESLDTSSSEESSADSNSEEDDDDGTLDNVSSDTKLPPESHPRQPNGIFRPQSEAVQPTDIENQEISSDDRNPFSNKGGKKPDFLLEASTLASNTDDQEASTEAHSLEEVPEDAVSPVTNKPLTYQHHIVVSSKVSTTVTDASDEKSSTGDATNESLESSEESTTDLNSKEKDDNMLRPESKPKQNGIFRPHPKPEKVQPSENHNPFSNKPGKKTYSPLETSTLSNNTDKDNASLVPQLPENDLQFVTFSTVPSVDHDRTGLLSTLPTAEETTSDITTPLQIKENHGTIERPQNPSNSIFRPKPPESTTPCQNNIFRPKPHKPQNDSHTNSDKLSPKSENDIDFSVEASTLPNEKTTVPLPPEEDKFVRASTIPSDKASNNEPSLIEDDTSVFLESSTLPTNPEDKNQQSSDVLFSPQVSTPPNSDSKITTPQTSNLEDSTLSSDKSEVEVLTEPPTNKEVPAGESKISKPSSIFRPKIFSPKNFTKPDTKQEHPDVYFSSVFTTPPNEPTTLLTDKGEEEIPTEIPPPEFFKDTSTIPSLNEETTSLNFEISTRNPVSTDDQSSIFRPKIQVPKNFTEPDKYHDNPDIDIPSVFTTPPNQKNSENEPTTLQSADDSDFYVEASTLPNDRQEEGYFIEFSPPQEDNTFYEDSTRPSNKDSDKAPGLDEKTTSLSVEISTVSTNLINNEENQEESLVSTPKIRPPSSIFRPKVYAPKNSTNFDNKNQNPEVYFSSVFTTPPNQDSESEPTTLQTADDSDVFVETSTLPNDKQEEEYFTELPPPQEHTTIFKDTTKPSDKDTDWREETTSLNLENSTPSSESRPVSIFRPKIHTPKNVAEPDKDQKIPDEFFSPQYSTPPSEVNLEKGNITPDFSAEASTPFSDTSEERTDSQFVEASTLPNNMDETENQNTVLPTTLPDEESTFNDLQSQEDSPIYRPSQENKPQISPPKPVSPDNPDIIFRPKIPILQNRTDDKLNQSTPGVSTPPAKNIENEPSTPEKDFDFLVETSTLPYDLLKNNTTLKPFYEDIQFNEFSTVPNNIDDKEHLDKDVTLVPPNSTPSNNENNEDSTESDNVTLSPSTPQPVSQPNSIYRPKPKPKPKLLPGVNTVPSVTTEKIAQLPEEDSQFVEYSTVPNLDKVSTFVPPEKSTPPTYTDNDNLLEPSAPPEMNPTEIVLSDDSVTDSLTALPPKTESFTTQPSSKPEVIYRPKPKPNLSNSTIFRPPLYLPQEEPDPEKLKEEERNILFSPEVSTLANIPCDNEATTVLQLPEKGVQFSEYSTIQSETELSSGQHETSTPPSSRDTEEELTSTDVVLTSPPIENSTPQLEVIYRPKPKPQPKPTKPTETSTVLQPSEEDLQFYEYSTIPNVDSKVPNPQKPVKPKPKPSKNIIFRPALSIPTKEKENEKLDQEEQGILFPPEVSTLPNIPRDNEATTVLQLLETDFQFSEFSTIPNNIQSETDLSSSQDEISTPPTTRDTEEELTSSDVASTSPPIENSTPYPEVVYRPKPKPQPKPTKPTETSTVLQPSEEDLQFYEYSTIPNVDSKVPNPQKPVKPKPKPSENIIFRPALSIPTKEKENEKLDQEEQGILFPPEVSTLPNIPRDNEATTVLQLLETDFQISEFSTIPNNIQSETDLSSSQDEISTLPTSRDTEEELTSSDVVSTSPPIENSTPQPEVIYRPKPKPQPEPTKPTETSTMLQSSEEDFQFYEYSTIPNVDSKVSNPQKPVKPKPKPSENIIFRPALSIPTKEKENEKLDQEEQGILFPPEVSTLPNIPRDNEATTVLQLLETDFQISEFSTIPNNIQSETDLSSSQDEISTLPTSRDTEEELTSSDVVSTSPPIENSTPQPEVIYRPKPKPQPEPTKPTETSTMLQSSEEDFQFYEYSTIPNVDSKVSNPQKPVKPKPKPSENIIFRPAISVPPKEKKNEKLDQEEQGILFSPEVSTLPNIPRDNEATTVLQLLETDFQFSEFSTIPNNIQSETDLSSSQHETSTPPTSRDTEEELTSSDVLSTSPPIENITSQPEIIYRPKPKPQPKPTKPTETSTVLQPSEEDFQFYEYSTIPNVDSKVPNPQKPVKPNPKPSENIIFRPALLVPPKEKEIEKLDQEEQGIMFPPEVSTLPPCDNKSSTVPQRSEDDFQDFEFSTIPNFGTTDQEETFATTERTTPPTFTEDKTTEKISFSTLQPDATLRPKPKPNGTTIFRPKLRIPPKEKGSDSTIITSDTFEIPDLPEKDHQFSESSTMPNAIDNDNTSLEQEVDKGPEKPTGDNDIPSSPNETIFRPKLHKQINSTKAEQTDTLFPPEVSTLSSRTEGSTLPIDSDIQTTLRPFEINTVLNDKNEQITEIFPSQYTTVPTFDTITDMVQEVSTLPSKTTMLNDHKESNKSLQEPPVKKKDDNFMDSQVTTLNSKKDYKKTPPKEDEVFFAHPSTLKPNKKDSYAHPTTLKPKKEESVTNLSTPPSGNKTKETIKISNTQKSQNHTKLSHSKTKKPPLRHNTSSEESDESDESGETSINIENSQSLQANINIGSGDNLTADKERNNRPNPFEPKPSQDNKKSYGTSVKIENSQNLNLNINTGKETLNTKNSNLSNATGSATDKGRGGESNKESSNTSVNVENAQKLNVNVNSDGQTISHSNNNSKPTAQNNSLSNAIGSGPNKNVSSGKFDHTSVNIENTQSLNVNINTGDRQNTKNNLPNASGGDDMKAVLKTTLLSSIDSSNVKKKTPVKLAPFSGTKNKNRLPAGKPNEVNNDPTELSIKEVRGDYTKTISSYEKNKSSPKRPQLLSVKTHIKKPTKSSIENNTVRPNRFTLPSNDPTEVYNDYPTELARNIYPNAVGSYDESNLLNKLTVSSEDDESDVTDDNDKNKGGPSKLNYDNPEKLPVDKVNSLDKNRGRTKRPKISSDSLSQGDNPTKPASTEMKDHVQKSIASYGKNKNTPKESKTKQKYSQTSDIIKNESIDNLKEPQTNSGINESEENVANHIYLREKAKLPPTDVEDAKTTKLDSETVSQESENLSLSTEEEREIVFVEFHKRKDQESLVYSVKVDLQKHSLSDYIPRTRFEEIKITTGFVYQLLNKHIGPIHRMRPYKLTFRNQIYELGENLLAGTSNMEEFQVSVGTLTEIEDGVFRGEKLKYLNLRDNKISEIASHAFDDMTQLTKISLINNQLAEYNPNWFHNCPKLQTILLSYNKIRTLPPFAFKNLNLNLHFRIFLDYNEITTISDSTFLKSPANSLNPQYFDNLRKKGFRIHLKGNRLKCVTEDVSKTFVAKVNTMKRNPFTCECQRKILKWKKTHPRIQIYLDYNSACLNT
ncbi:mucin-2-like [Tribolium castaneum]|uniref:mucin-2-like n=1 Tax=Tribolium castaneum TaxID=7070 RepID=UPI0030FEAD32